MSTFLHIMSKEWSYVCKIQNTLRCTFISTESTPLVSLQSVCWNCDFMIQNLYYSVASIWIDDSFTRWHHSSNAIVPNDPTLYICTVWGLMWPSLNNKHIINMSNKSNVKTNQLYIRFEEKKLLQPFDLDKTNSARPGCYLLYFDVLLFISYARHQISY